MVEPTVLTLARTALDPAEYKKRSATEDDYHRFIDEPTVIVDAASGRPSIVYLELDDDCSDVCRVLPRIHYLENARTSGLRVRSKVFGHQPRIPFRQDYCETAALATEDAEAHAIVAGYATKVARYYERFNPDLYAEHQKQVEQVLPDWRLEDTVFTSGIINKNNPLLYHFDTGNFRNVWSNMLVFKHDMHGGYLAVPEYDAGFALKHNSLLMFDGQNLLHGVTPIHLHGPESFRYSIVFYSLRKMWQCLEPGEEARSFQKRRTEREWRRLERDQAGIKLTRGGGKRKVQPDAPDPA